MSETIRFPVGGMTCGSCVNRIMRAVRKVDGVTRVTVDLRSETATVRREPALVSNAALAAAVADAGYEADLEAAEVLLPGADMMAFWRSIGASDHGAKSGLPYGGRSVNVRSESTGVVGPSNFVAKSAGIAFARIFIGVMWLFEITVGHNWKIGGLGSGPNPLWIGDRAGESVAVNAQKAIADGDHGDLERG